MSNKISSGSALIRRDDDVVISAVGAVTACGIGLEAIWDYARSDAAPPQDAQSYGLNDFKAVAHFSDKRMMKAVSTSDALGLAAVEILKKAARWPELGVKPEMIGVYAGAPSASTNANDYYMDALKAAMHPAPVNGILVDTAKFGQTCMEAKPTTLLIGLPNNVLCYAAMLLDARGPNSNYTSSMLSGMTAVMNGARRVSRGQLAVAVAGGFAYFSATEVNEKMYLEAGFDAFPYADGAAFTTLERRAPAVARGMKPLASLLSFATGSDAGNAWSVEASGQSLERAIQRALNDAGLTPDDIGLVLATDSARRGLETRGLSVLSRVFANARARPAVGNFSRRFGDLREAGGILEMALAPRIMAAGAIPQGLASEAAMKAGFKREVPGARAALVMRQGFSGESSVAVVGRD